jgi:tRNA synthetases class II core domain (F)
MLHKLANQEGGFTPKKYFSIDRVFRNEAMDATHLCEFHQVEGLVADRNLNLGHLIGTIRTFFEKIGITQLRFKPAYNPYTEPSMEIFGYHPELKKWTEIGNSGMFRPEMLRPMGLPEDVRVIAWGLSLERPTMIKYKIENIRDLFGYVCGGFGFRGSLASPLHSSVCSPSPIPPLLLVCVAGTRQTSRGSATPPSRASRVATPSPGQSISEAGRAGSGAARGDKIITRQRYTRPSYFLPFLATQSRR